MTPFSLLLPVYHRDNPDHLRRAFVSAVQEQTRAPDEVVLVRDGPVGQQLALAIDELVATSPVPVQRIDLPANVGLGQALDTGIRACRHDVIARMDADDISLPERFARQLPLIEAGADIVGSALIEFDEDEEVVVGLRTPPTSEVEIRTWSRFHQPFNHPTVVYRRAQVMAAGGYQDLPLLEDYWLFARMIQDGARVANLADPLVKYRVGTGAYHRRGGFALLRSEVVLQGRLRRVGFVTRSQYVRNLAVRGGYRLVPATLRRRAYRRLIAGKGAD
ncbi:MAG TPA: glycosyltransferase [Actinomycetes bacterium]|nr:glycosyltransferase [Actinomycetes bacterium]